MRLRRLRRGKAAGEKKSPFLEAGVTCAKALSLWEKEGAYHFEKNIKQKEVIQDMDEKKAGLDHTGLYRAWFKKQWEKKN